MEREILHLVVPAFPIALARAGDPQLRRRPVAVAPGNSERALVQCVSSEAAAEGVVPGTPIFRARRLCPALTLIPPDPLAIARGTRELSRLSAEFSPLVEPSAGRVFLDLTGTRRLFGPPRDVASRLERSIARQIGVVAMAGTGANKLVTRVAADAMPEPGVYDVFHGAERSFLAPFPLAVLPGIGTQREAVLLRDLNLRQVRDVAALTVPQLRLAVGPFAPLLHERACGIDRTPVQSPRASTELVEEAFLEQEDNDDQVLLAELFRLVEGVGLRLRRCGTQASQLRLVICYADGVTEEGLQRLAEPESLDLGLFGAVEALFLRTCKRRVRVRSLRLACQQVSACGSQLDLFGAAHEAAERSHALQTSLDRLRERYGSQAVSWGRALAQRPQPEPRSPDTDLQPLDLSEYRYHTLTTRGA